MSVEIEILAEFWDHKQSKAVPVLFVISLERLDWVPLNPDHSDVARNMPLPAKLKAVKITNYKESGTYTGRVYECGESPSNLLPGEKI